MKKPPHITRRTALMAGGASLGGLLLPGLKQDLPPTYGNVLRMGDTFTYAVHRTLLPRHRLAREYSPHDISPFPAIGRTNPGDPDKPGFSEAYRTLQRGAFTDWRLLIDGRVASPRSFSLAELKQLPSRTQITRHVCEEGWSAIGEWTGVPLRHVLEAMGVLPTARFVVMYSFDDWADSIDMIDALHPQALLAYGMNGRDLPIPHGAPVRLRIETQLGYKSMKYLRHIRVTDEFDDGAEKGNIRNGWAWYAGI